MSDLLSRLESLRDAPPAAVDDEVVASDLNRARRALTTRRRRRLAVAGVAMAAVTIGAASSAFALHSQHPQPAAGTSLARTPVSSKAPAVQLVGYHGRQLPGYSVKAVPRGYVLQGISGSVLDVAEAGDHSSLDVFVGKITVMLNDEPGPTTGVPVTVNGHPGRVSDQDGVQVLTYRDGPHNVEVQSWSNIHITRAQLVQFAGGVTVLPGAEVGHG